MLACKPATQQRRTAMPLTPPQYRVLEHLVENMDAGLEKFNRADIVSDELDITIEEARAILKFLENKHFVEHAGKIYSPTPQGRNEL